MHVQIADGRRRAHVWHAFTTQAETLTGLCAFGDRHVRAAMQRWYFNIAP